ncbi:hypothetical protein BH20ACT9_BH20ACT9_13980 [soil metagenome]
MFWISVITTASLVEAFGDVGRPTLVAAGAVIVATYWTIQPMYLAPLMRRVIGSDRFGYAHTSSSVCWLAGAVGPALGSPRSHSTEKLTLPRRLSFFKDVNVSTALVIGVIMLVAMGFADGGVLAEQAAQYNPDLNPWVWGLIQALRFAAGIAILLYGVRMFLAEIVPAFKGISERLIPGSRPALDVPTVFPFAPTAVMVGFLSSTAVFLVCMGVFAAAGWFVLVPPMIQLFFPSAGAAVFGNALGGWRGAVFGGAVSGLFLAVGQAVTWGMLSDTAPELATLADPDWYILAWLIMLLGRPLQGAAGPWIWAVAGAVAAILVVWMLVARRVGPAPEEPARGEEAGATTSDARAESEETTT